MLEELSPGSFEPHVGPGWTMTTGTAEVATLEVELELVEVRRFAGGGPRREPFSLLFLGPASPVLPQSIRTFRHPTLGALDLFVVPVGPAPDGRMTYEVAFN